MFQQRHQLIALDQKPGRVRHQQRTKCLVRGIVSAIPDRLRLLRPLAESERILFLRLLDRLLELRDIAELDDSLGHPFFQFILEDRLLHRFVQLELGDGQGMLLHRLHVSLRGLGLEVVDRLECLHHCRRFQHSGLANEHPPQVGKL
jgi:hypothetical protein